MSLNISFLKKYFIKIWDSLLDLIKQTLIFLHNLSFKNLNDTSINFNLENHINQELLDTHFNILLTLRFLFLDFIAVNFLDGNDFNMFSNKQQKLLSTPDLYFHSIKFCIL